jgi:ligand-binding sensor domain-containing protein
VKAGLVDRKGRLWFAAGDTGAVAVYDGESWTAWTASATTVTRDGRSTSEAAERPDWGSYRTSLAEDGEGRIWSSAYGSGCDVWDGESWTHVGAKQGLASPLVSFLSKGPGGTVLVGAEDGLYASKAGGPPAVELVCRTASEEKIGTAAVDGRGTIYVAVGSRIMSLEDGKLLPVDLEGAAVPAPVTTLRAGPSGIEWFATAGGGLFRRDDVGYRRTVFADDAGPDANWIVGLECDGAGRLWAASRGRHGRVFRFADGGWRVEHSEGGELKSGIASLGLSAARALVMRRPWAENLVRTADGWTNLENEAPLAVGRGGEKWYGSGQEPNAERPRWGALRRVGPNGVEKVYAAKADMGASWIADVALDDEGRPWVATSDGVASLAGGKWRRWTTDDGLPDARADAVAVAPDGGVWVATRGGLAAFRGGKWLVVTTADGLPCREATSLAFDVAGGLWVGTYGGIGRLSPEGVRSVK